MNIIKEEKRYSKRDLMKLYNVSRYTLNDWVEKRGLNFIEISSHSKYISGEELLKFENSKKKK